jgi:hypothetical protein
MLEYHEDWISRHDESMRALNNNLGSLLAIMWWGWYQILSENLFGQIRWSAWHLRYVLMPNSESTVLGGKGNATGAQQLNAHSAVATDQAYCSPILWL